MLSSCSAAAQLASAARQLEAMRDDLERSLKSVADPARRDALRGVYGRLAKLV